MIDQHASPRSTWPRDVLIAEAEADHDYERMQRDLALAPPCGKLSPTATLRRWPHTPCDREQGHPPPCEFWSL